MGFRFKKRLDGFEAVIAAVVISFVTIDWQEPPKPFNWIVGMLAIASYVILFIVWLGSNYIWPPEGKRGEGK